MLFKSDSTGLCKTYSSRRYTTQFHTRRTYVQHAASVKHDNPARPAGSRARRRASRRAGDRRCWEHGQHRQLGKQRQQWVPPSCDRFRFSPISYSIWLCLCVFFFLYLISLIITADRPYGAGDPSTVSPYHAYGYGALNAKRVACRTQCTSRGNPYHRADGGGSVYNHN